MSAVKGSKKRLPSPKESEAPKRVMKSMQRRLSQQHQSPLLKFGFKNNLNNDSSSGSGTTKQQAYPAPPSLDIPITCQKDMTEFCVVAMSDPRVRTLVKTMKQEMFEEEIEQINDNTSRINLLEDTVDRQQSEIDSLKQDSKRKSLRIFNSDWNDDSANTTDLVVDFIRNKLHCTNFAQHYIDYTHWAGKRSQDKDGRPILVSFIHSSNRDNILSHAKSAPEGSTINEDLIPSLAFLAYCARQLKRSGDISETWVKHGKVNVKSHERAKTIRIQSIQDLLNQVQPSVQVHDFSWKMAITVLPDIKIMDYIKLVRSGDYKQLIREPTNSISHINSQPAQMQTPKQGKKVDKKSTPGKSNRNAPWGITPNPTAAVSFSLSDSIFTSSTASLGGSVFSFTMPTARTATSSNNTSVSSVFTRPIPSATTCTKTTTAASSPLLSIASLSAAQPSSGTNTANVTTDANTAQQGSINPHATLAASTRNSLPASPRPVISPTNGSNPLLLASQGHPPGETDSLPGSLLTAGQALNAIIDTCASTLDSIDNSPASVNGMDTGT